MFNFIKIMVVTNGLTDLYLICNQMKQNDYDSFVNMMTCLIIQIIQIIKCTYVDKIIHNCPLTITNEMINEYSIHLVGMSDDYVIKWS
jgi:hypothetical protein